MKVAFNILGWNEDLAGEKIENLWKLQLSVHSLFCNKSGLKVESDMGEFCVVYAFI